jgi:hypothetical protein
MTSFWIYPILFFTGLSAGFVDSIAGGGGLITVPVLLGLGLSPADALGTNKLQACFGSGSATYHYGCAGLISWKQCRMGVLFTAIGSIIGTLFVQQLNEALLRQAIPILLIAIALYLLFRPDLGTVARPPAITLGPFNFAAGLLLGFYDGIFGPGTGSFWAIAYVLLLGYDLTRATAHTKVMNFTSNLGSLLIFVLGNHVLLGAGIIMGAGQLLGARLGSRAVIKQGGRLIRPIFVTVVIVISIKLLYQTFTR